MGIADWFLWRERPRRPKVGDVFTYQGDRFHLERVDSETFTAYLKVPKGKVRPTGLTKNLVWIEDKLTWVLPGREGNLTGER